MAMANAHSDLPVVAVIGGAGYIGSVLVRLLLGEGFHVRVVDNYLFGSDGVKNLRSPNLELIEEDICSTRAISSAINGSDIVVLLSAIVGHRARDIKQFNTRNINFLGSSVALDASIEHGVSRFIFASTDSVYGLQTGLLYETGIPEPVSLYSRLKLRMEERIINAKTRNFHPTSLRIANCYGYSPRMRFDLVVNGLVRDALLKKEISIVSGEQVRSFIHVADVAQAILSSIKAHENLVSGEVFNVGNSQQSVSLAYVANVVKTLIPDIEVSFLEGEPDLVNYRLSCSKIEKVLDFIPQHSMETAIGELRDRILAKEYSDPYSLKYHNT